MIFTQFLGFKVFLKRPSQKSGMFVVCLLYVFCMFFVRSMFCACLWKWLGSKACFMYVLCLVYVCFNMIGSHSLQYYWFPPISHYSLVITYTAYRKLNTVLKCAESLAAAKAATLTATRKRQHWPQGGSIELAAARRRQQ